MKNIQKKHKIAIYHSLLGANETDINGDGAYVKSLPKELLFVSKVLRDWVLEKNIKIKDCEYYKFIPEKDDDKRRIKDIGNLLYVLQKVDGVHARVRAGNRWGSYLERAYNSLVRYKDPYNKNPNKLTIWWKGLFMAKVNMLSEEDKVNEVDRIIKSFEEKNGEIKL